MDADGCVSPDPDPPRPPHQLDAASLNRLCRPDDLDGGTGTFMLCLRHCKAWAASNRAAAQLPNVAASEAISWFWCTADAVKGTTSFDGRTDYYPGGGGGGWVHHGAVSAEMLLRDVGCQRMSTMWRRGS